MARVYQLVKERGPDGEARWIRSEKPVAGGRWFIDYRDRAGRQIRQRTDAATKTEALNVLRARMAENVKADILGVQSTESIKPIPFEEFFKKTYMPCSATRVKPISQERKEGLARHLLPYFGSLPVQSITAGRIQEFLTKRAGQGASVSERNLERALLSNVMNEAFRRELIAVNPVSRVRPLRNRNARDLWLRPEDVEAILEEAPSWVKPVIVFAVHTGLRLQELADLTWDALEHSPGFVRIGAESKGGRARFIPLNSAARGALAGLARNVGPDGAIPWVFYDARKGRARLGNSAYRSFKRAAAKAAIRLRRAGKVEAARRLEEATFHTTRHTFASWALQAGIPEAEVQQYLGHASPIMTRRYTHLACPTLRRNALEVLAVPAGDSRFQADGASAKAGAV
jgi:integrase